MPSIIGTATGTGTVLVAILCIETLSLCVATVPGITGTATCTGTGLVDILYVSIETQRFCGGYGARYYR